MFVDEAWCEREDCLDGWSGRHRGLRRVSKINKFKGSTPIAGVVAALVAALAALAALASNYAA